jgi:hypothetical protein
MSVAIASPIETTNPKYRKFKPKSRSRMVRGSAKDDIEQFRRLPNYKSKRFLNLPQTGQNIVCELFNIPDIAEIFLREHEIGVVLSPTSSWDDCQSKILHVIGCVLGLDR